MGVSARPGKIEKRLGNLYLAIDEGNTKKAKRLLGNLKKMIGADPDLVRADILIRRQEISRK